MPFSYKNRLLFQGPVPGLSYMQGAPRNQPRLRENSFLISFPAPSTICSPVHNQVSTQQITLSVSAERHPHTSHHTSLSTLTHPPRPTTPAFFSSMGVTGAFQFLQGRYTPEDVDEKHLGDDLHVDFNALFVGYSANTMSSRKAANWKKPPLQQKPLDTIIGYFVSTLVKKFPPFLTTENSILHFDGCHTKEKEAAHVERLKKFMEEYGDHVSDTNAELDKALDALGRIAINSPPTVGQRRSILGCASRAIASYKKIRTFSLDQPTTRVIGSALSALGWRVCLCRGESDHCISSRGARTVVTTDGDYLFRGARILLRKDPKVHDKYTAYVVKDILQTLGVHSDAWKVVGIVSGNDFSKNIHGLGMTKNFASIKSLCNRRPVSACTILQRYCKLNSENDPAKERELRGRFEMAEAVFIRNQETLLDDQSSSNRRDVADLEGKLVRVLGQVSGALERYNTNYWYKCS